MESRVCARLNQGIDSFVRVTSVLRRKEFSIKEINMKSQSSHIDLDIVVYDDSLTGSVVKQISKLADVKEITVI
ncbi:MAG: ACT domain-containing protein [Tepidibacter sp.]|jgi:acetolactate synthase regulatory subunit|uniref:ACT domain-containing protein n=1 Tax=Tepidibacter sp. TaxID=2529387 RepID=UPI0025CECB65|nr:ACT domain-containing protein [Tepidibacter sp.]MCT4508109.1 ACT domain-containing protein [Tepidibacter sp.]